MTDVDPFIHFDPAPYLSTPMLPLQTLPTLCAALSSRMPGDAPPYIKQAEAAMSETAEEAQDAMVIRLRETNQATLSFDLALDNGMDGVWVLFRDRARSWAAYQRPGLDFLLGDDELTVDFEEVRDKATRARALASGLFGDRLDMLTRRYPEQLQLMANVLGLIEADGLEDDISELCGEEVLPILRRCQVAYEAMVDRRASKEPASRTNLRKVRTKLQRRIVKYSSLMLTMLDEDDPVKSIARVEKALEPMITFRSPRAGSKDEGTDVESEDVQGEVAENEDVAAEE